MKITVFQDDSLFQAIRPEQWNGLLAFAMTNVIFLTWEWQSLWWKHMDPGKLLVLTFSNDHDELQAITPLFHSQSDDGSEVLSIIGCEEISDYLDFIVPEPLQNTVCSELLAYVTSSEAPHWDRIQLCNLPESSTAYSILPKEARKAGLHVESRIQDRCPSITLPHSWEEYLTSLDKKQRHEIRRKIRRAESEAASWFAVSAQNHDLAEEMEAFVRLHRISSPDKNTFMDSQMKAFFFEMAKTMLERSWFHLSFLEQRGERIASLLSFDYNNSFQVYNSGYNAEQYGALSPGIVLISYCIQYAIEQGRQSFDFLRGEEEYKYRMGAKPTDVYELIIHRNGA